MKKVGIIDVDGRNFPNLALMKISKHHKSLGDSVEWVNYLDNYDIVYQSKVFTFTPDVQTWVNSGEIIRGGTGYDVKTILPAAIDNSVPDYSIYPKYTDAYGFLTRGCPNKCSWCVVPSKEGEIHAYSDIEHILDGRKSAVLMDNNVLAHEHGIRQIEKIIKLGIKVDFNQGLDARIISEDPNIAKMLGRVKWLKPLRMACDTMSQMKHIEKATRLLRENGCKPKNYFVYMLVKDIDDALLRAEFLRGLDLDPFAQPYRDFNSNMVEKSASNFARWVNHKAVFNSVPWSKYSYRK